MEVSGLLWLGTIGLIVAMLAVDLFAHRKASIIEPKEAALWSSLWLALGLGYGVFLWNRFGEEIGQQYFSGFVIEKSLAVDNVFLWALIFSAFAVPRQYQHRVLFLGVLGALVFRGIFIALGAVLIDSFAWVLYIFAGFLIYTGLKMLLHRNVHFDPMKSRFYRLFQKSVPTTEKFYGQRLLVRKGSVILATPLLAVLALIEFTDIIFAVDSIPAIFAVTDEPFIVFTANAFAILGLRAMYFLLADLMHRFVYLKVGLSVILIWVGIKLGLHGIYKVPTALSLGVIVVVISVCVIASLLMTRSTESPTTSENIAPEVLEADEAEISELNPLFRRRASV